jgi:hypothetical protein
MRNGSQVIGGMGLVFLGILLVSGWLDWLLSVVGTMALIAGIVLFAMGGFSTARARQ